MSLDDNKKTGHERQVHSIPMPYLLGLAHHTKGKKGFTLAELLIALAILGVIATFTIPKILSAQQNSRNVAEAKEVAAMISGAFQKAKLDGVVSSTTKPSDLTPYMNYVSIDTSGKVIDAPPLGTTATCDSSNPCIKLHNGGYLWFLDIVNFGGTTSLNCLAFIFDPDPSNNTSSTADGPLKAVQFQLYYDGFLTTRGQAKAGSTTSGGGSFGPGAYDPSWFTW
jgi:prepilin-type N-terminal cleavage/methylation domain-containing protein